MPAASAADEHSRSFWLHVPAGYRPRSRAALVLVFHGAGGTGIGMQGQTGLSALADRRGFLVAYPQGLVQPAVGITGWAASGPLDPEAHGIDEGLFVSDLLTAIQVRYCVDPARISAVGFSNGADLMGYLACVLSDRVGAFAAVEGEFFAIRGGCHPSHPASILGVHALDDNVAPLAGVPARASPAYYAPAVPTWLGRWAASEGCSAAAEPVLRSVAVTAEEWTGCDDGTAVLGYRLAHGGHTWPRALGAASGSVAILDFLSAHPLRTPHARFSPLPGTPVPTLSAPGVGVSSLRTFHLPTPAAEPVDVAVGRGGVVWFTEFHGDKIGRITPSGALTEYRVPTSNAEPYQLTAGPDGAMWFTEYNTARLGRVSPNGKITELRMPAGSAGGLGITSSAHRIGVADPARAIDRLTPAGGVTRIPLPAGSGTPLAIAPGPAGSVWVSEFTGFFEHGRTLLRAGGTAPSRTIRLANPASDVDALAAGPAGTLWFTDYGAGQIDEQTADGHLRRFTDPAAYGGLNDITLGPDGAMWFTDQAGLVSRITPTGRISQLALSTAGSAPNGITGGPKRTIWVAETGANAIVRLSLP